ncbi:MAG: trehalose-phosphatase, partial [Nitriliruptorales bacterium]|nr:trehalose-phosphatase [Nitriliruptorales bacterium]
MSGRGRAGAAGSTGRRGSRHHRLAAARGADPLTPDQLAVRVAEDPATTGLILDFDGVLAPIVSDPSDSTMTRGLRDPLRALARRLAVVAIVSGRPAAFLRDRAAVAGVRLLGVYGTEEWRDGRPVVRPEAEQWQPALDVARDRLAAALSGHRGLLLEDKGLAVAVHWRNAENREGAGAFVEQVCAGIAHDTRLAQEPGKFVMELRPPLDWDKGVSVRALVEELNLRFVVYAGDDRGDLPAFSAAHE